MEKKPEFRGGRKKNQIISLTIVGVLIFLTFYTLRKITGNLGFSYLWSVIRKLEGKYLILALVFMATFVIIEGQCLAVLAKALGHRAKFSSATVYAASDIYFSAISPSATGGQPASAYYMARDGIPVSQATTILVVNILLYTLSLVIMGIWALAVKFRFFLHAGVILQVFFAVGMVLQLLLIALCLLCMFSQDIIRGLGHWIVEILHRFRFIRGKEDKLEQIDALIGNYQAGVKFIKKKPLLMASVLVGNILQRVAFFSIGWFVYKAFGLSQLNYGEFVAIQSLLAMAVNSLPIPGAIGVSEGSFLLLFQSVYPAAVLAPAMLLTRGINYYLCFALCGIYMLIYHVCVGKRTEGEENE